MGPKQVRIVVKAQQTICNKHCTVNKYLIAIVYDRLSLAANQQSIHPTEHSDRAATTTHSSSAYIFLYIIH